MADKKISDLTAQTGANLSGSDLVEVVDVGASPESRKVTLTEFLKGGWTVAGTDMSGANVVAADDDLLVADGGAAGTIKRLSVANLAIGIGELHSNAWAAATGTVARAAYTTYTAPTYTAGDWTAGSIVATAQAIADHIQIVSRTLGGAVNDLRTTQILRSA